jgi:hypothetical protein
MADILDSQGNRSSGASLGRRRTDGGKAGIAIAALAAASLFAAPATAEERAPGGLELRTAFDLTYEYTFRSKEQLVEPYAIKSGIDIARLYLDQPALASFDLGLGAPAGLSVAIGGNIRREWEGDYFKADNFLPMGLPGNPVAMENFFVTKGALYWKSPGLDISFGRDKVDLNNCLEGGFYPSSRLPYLDAFLTKGRLGPLTMDWMIASIQARKSWETKYGAGYDVNPNASLGTIPGSDETQPYGFELDENPTTVIEALHRFSWDFGAFQLGLGAQIMYSRRNNHFALSDFFPVISWHQAEVLQTNLCTLADASWEPLPGLKIVGQAGLDDVNANFAGMSDSKTTTIDAYVLGATWAGELRPGPLSARLELGYTHYLWGNFDGYDMNPGDQNPLARFQYRYLSDRGAMLLPLSSPYGPGALWLEAAGSLGIEGTGLKVGTELLLLSKNVEANLIDTPYNTDEAKDGARTYFGSLRIPVEYRLGPFVAGAAPAVLTRNGTWWMELALSVSYKAGGSTPIARQSAPSSQGE